MSSFTACREQPPADDLSIPPTRGQIAQRWDFLFSKLLLNSVMARSRRRTADEGQDLSNAAILAVESTNLYLDARDNPQLAAIQQSILALQHSFQQQIGAVQQSITTAQQSITAARQDITAVQQSITTAQQSITVAQQSITAARQDITAAQQSITAVQQDIQDIKATITLLVRNIDHNHTAVQHLI
ncbi:hypothetical protein PCASD_00302 [Puccinia coronata f. sp. avenae]|uniref:Uncharacterized protein n=1 Tax=Puccinia coronata f. sp. avenae TaxID=200324 RepID=A0A2N5VN76_9BASI|nr:hypothetical protein PCASD_21421 [Puccinia coronata f. sp. avenae]PLW51441.1 hypothetical protein PCASD_00302 [Puccinia coronata f. sp. avenae]